MNLSPVPRAPCRSPWPPLRAPGLRGPLLRGGGVSEQLALWGGHTRHPPVHRTPPHPAPPHRGLQGEPRIPPCMSRSLAGRRSGAPCHLCPRRDTHRIVQLRFLAVHRVPHVATGKEWRAPGHSLGSRRLSEVPLFHRHPGPAPRTRALLPAPRASAVQSAPGTSVPQPSWRDREEAAANGKEE